ncbi:RNase H domain-containing protein [Trichonephila clavipes]|nr:RNase H domain-containing protein [Trichonephila clavipes]
MELEGRELVAPAATAYKTFGLTDLTITYSVCTRRDQRLDFADSCLRLNRMKIHDQWIPAHVHIEGNEIADFLANEARTLQPLTSPTTVFDANSVAKQKLCSNRRKKLSLPELNYSREITSTTTRLRTKLLPDGSRSYVECRHCPDTQLNPEHLFSCPSVVGALFKIDNDCSMNILFSDRVLDVATTVIHAFGNI